MRQMYDSVAGGKSWDAVVSSPLARCLDFATDFTNEERIPLIVEPGIAELDFGEWEGKTADEISVSDPRGLSDFYADPYTKVPHKGESLDDFKQRVLVAWNKISDEHRGQRILIVTHSGVMRLLIAQILEFPLKNLFRIQIDHADMVQVRCYYEKNDVFYQLHFSAN